MGSKKDVREKLKDVKIILVNGDAKRDNEIEFNDIKKEADVKGLEDLSAPCILPFEILNGLRYTYDLGEKELENVGKILIGFQITLYGFIDFEHFFI